MDIVLISYIGCIVYTEHIYITVIVLASYLLDPWHINSIVDLPNYSCLLILS